MPAISAKLQETAAVATDKASQSLDAVVPPHRRQDIYAQLQRWSSQNPKLSTLLAANTALAIIPLLTFAIFSLTILISSLLTCLFLALCVALGFTAMCVGGALFVLVPVLCISVLGACSVWFWGMVAWWVVSWFKGEDPLKNAWERANAKTGVKYEANGGVS